MEPGCVLWHAGKLQATSEAFGLFFASGALHVQLHSTAAAMAFMTKYADRLVFPKPALVPEKPACLRSLIVALAGVESLPAVTDTSD